MTEGAGDYYLAYATFVAPDGDQFALDVTGINVPIDAPSIQAAPGPIPGAGLLSYLPLGILGVGSMGWKRLRMRSV
jgi:hypothetical protein